MPSPSEDAPVGGVPPEVVAQLAVLYDRFANALDPFGPERDQAETLFEQEVMKWYDFLPPPKTDLQAFRRGLILRCRRHLSAMDKPSST